MKNDTKIRENTDKLLSFVSEKFESNELDNQSLLELIQLGGDYLNLKTIPNYAKANGMSYEGVKKCRQIKLLFGARFVVDNY